VRHSGFLNRLPPSTVKTILNAVHETRNNKKLILNFCLNYGGRQDIIQAVNRWLDVRNPREQITLKQLEKHLQTADMPGVDLMIRTGGEYRISNFLTWQLAYAELVFMDVLWPDFKPYHLYKAIYEYQKRERRFGGL
jgi:undecaprenyl diphosphate synthase